MDRLSVLKTMLATGNRYSIDVKTLNTLAPKLIILSLKFVSKKTLWTEIFKDDYVDWELVNGVAHKNILGGCAEWLGLLKFCTWDEFSRFESAIQLHHQPLHALRCHMKECSLDTGASDAWTLVCRAFLLLLVQGLPNLHVIELLTCDVFKTNTKFGCMQLLAKQASLPLISFSWDENG